MANELNFDYTAGQVVEVGLYFPGWTQQGVNIAMTEVSAGRYSASVPGATPAAVFLTRFEDVNAGNASVGRGELGWDGTQEIVGLAQLDALKTLIRGGRDIDFVGNDTNGWQRIERDEAGVEVARYNLFDETATRIDETVASFIGRLGMISAEVLL